MVAQFRAPDAPVRLWQALCKRDSVLVARTAMRLYKQHMTSAEFNAALREAGFSVDHGRIVDLSGRCPGFAALPTFNRGAVIRSATLLKVIHLREAEIKRRADSERSS
jgi:hypothetical protein